jgi:hypothetical protein
MSPITWLVLLVLGLLLAVGAIIGVTARGISRILAPAGASVVVGLLLGAAAIFGITLMVQQDTKPPLPGGDPSSSVLNRVEYGNRS